MVKYETDRMWQIILKDAGLDYKDRPNWSQEEIDDYMRAISRYVRKKGTNKEIFMELRNFLNLSTDYWHNMERINCYAYALGCDIPTGCFNIRGYNPGCFYEAINKIKLDLLNSDTLVERMEMDFETLEFDYHVVSPNEKIGEGEWKIAFFYDRTFVKGNFHFLRQGKDGLWYHKPGFLYNNFPTNKDHNDNIITNPADAFFKVPMGTKKMYEYDRCYSLKMR